MRDLTVIFDLDGTLVDTAPDLIAAANHALGDIGLDPVPGFVLAPAIALGARFMILDGLKHTGRHLPDGEVDRLLKLFLDYYLANIANESRPYPGAVDALTTLKAQGARLGICTNKRSHLSNALIGALGLNDLVHAVVGRDSVKKSKPHPEHLMETIRLADGDPKRAIMIGDTAVDVATARAAGVPVIGVPFGYSDRPITELAPDAVITHYDQLLPAIESLVRRFAAA
ncbi:MAG: HAD-IA family hydrolase [Hyphomicrobiaceae bacterium]|nr:HAD-IA family hydrolase [Hyphomicrobiaceae bacterium]